MAKHPDFPNVKYIERHQRGCRYKRRKPKNVLADLGGKNFWIKYFDYPRSVSKVDVIRTVNRLAAQHDTIINTSKHRRLTDQERITAEFNASIWTETSTDAELREMLERMLASRGGERNLDAHERAFVSAVQNDGEVKIGQPITVAAEIDIEEHGADRENKPFRYAVGLFTSAVGDINITEISRQQVKTMIEANSRLAPSTLQRAVNVLSGLVTRTYRELELERSNPFRGHSIKNSSSSNRDKLPFNKEMLAAINSYMATNSRLKPETRRLLQIMMLTGGGIKEIGGLVAADVDVDGEVPFVWIRPNTLRGVKNKHRNRMVPLIGEALDAVREALDAAGDGKKPEHTALFPTFLKYNGRGVDKLSERACTAIRTAGVPKSKRITANSFRHSFKAALRSAKVEEFLHRRLMGHSGEGVADNYGSPEAMLDELRDSLEAAIPYLGDVNPMIYSSDEKMV